jgi:flagellar motor switch protein FliN/FliY
VDDVFQAALEEEPPAPGGEPGGGAPAGGGGTPADGSPATAAEPRTGSSLSALYDLTLPVSIELGRATMTVEEVLALDKGSVVELDRLAGEPVDIYVGDRHLAQGEVVVVREHFGVRITRLISPGAGAAELV